jgi:hypothetical protein
MEWIEDKKEWDILEGINSKEVIILPLDDSNSERVWNFGVERVVAEIDKFMTPMQKLVH